MSFENLPSDTRTLRACKICGLIKTADQFNSKGCENCEDHFQNEEDNVDFDQLYTQFFDGNIGLMDPKSSTIARKLGLSNYIPGCYALIVTDEIPQIVKDILNRKSIKYRAQPHAF